MNFREIDVNWIYAFLKEWQTLIAALIALGAAYWTVRMMRRQIEQAAQHERERNRARYTAARAMLPLALADVMEWIGAHAETYKSARPKTYPKHLEKPYPKNGVIPEINQQTLASLEKMLTAEDNTVIQNILSDIIHDYQIVRSNWISHVNSDKDDSFLEATRDTALARAAYLYARVALLYPYARREASVVDEAEMPKALNNATFLLWGAEEYPDAYETAQMILAKRSERIVAPLASRP
ncbi:hypothetical protein [Elioraea rosea]|uniref:hypothetical protein n=1 Tax=Elioraea rosea TaxID=2492390 RepID=UPI001185908A|nr:hypothetical protein [Elioraea rosea]